MKVQLLPSSCENGAASQSHRLTTFVIDDLIAVDAGSLPFSCSESQRKTVRDIILSHTHIDHIAGLPIFIDDLFATIERPVKVHATTQTIKALESHIFNWDIYPNFAELRNEFGVVLEYCEFAFRKPFEIGKFEIEAVEVNHHGPSAGFILNDGTSVVAFSGDTSETGEFWNAVNDLPKIEAVFVECSFPNRLQDLAVVSHHLTPNSLATEIAKLGRNKPRILVTNIKASFRDEVIKEISSLGNTSIEIMSIGDVYEF